MRKLVRGGEWLCLAVSAAMLAGCEESGPQIRSYHVPPPLSGEDADGPGEPQMLLGALVPHNDQTWFFKAVGPPDLVQAERDNFRQFIQSLQFVAGDKVAPTWTVPQGWTEKPGSGMRYATLSFGDGDRSAELTVIGLPNPDEDEDSYTLANVNRWREQLQLSTIDAEQLASEAEVIPLGGTEATLVQMQGTGSGAMSGRMVPDGTGAPAMPPDHPVLTDSLSHPQAAAELTYSAPAEWTEVGASGLRRAAFTVSEGEQSVEVTIIDLVAEAGELLPNVNRWREQIELGETTADELARDATKIPFASAVGDYVKLVGPQDAGRRQTILAAVVLQSGRSWFVKLIGDSELASQEEERFQTFVRSVQF